MKKIKDLFDLRSLQKNINTAVHELKNNDEDFWVVETIVDGHHGADKGKIFYNMFGFRYNEEYWFDEICGKFKRVENELKKLVDIPDNFILYISFNPYDGCIDLFVSMEDKIND